jgi:hypothetical protein
VVLARSWVKCNSRNRTNLRIASTFLHKVYNINDPFNYGADMKKIVIILEHHIDHIATNAVTGLVKHLHENGYNSLCLEYPGDAASIQAGLEYTAQEMKRNGLRPALEFLIKGDKVPRNKEGTAVIDGEPVNAQMLINMDFAKLCPVLQTYVSSTKYTDMARYIQEIKPTESKLELVKTYRAAGHEVIGADLELSMDERMHPTAAQFAAREKHMCDKLEEQVKSEKYCVFVVGKSHVGGLVRALAARGLLEQTTFLDPCSEKTALVEAADPEYATFVTRYPDIVNRFTLNPKSGLAEHLPNLTRLLEISTAVKNKSV